MSVVIRPDTEQDRAAIWNVNQAAFEGDAEANLVEDFYPRFGFSSELAERLPSPFGGGKTWMVLELVPGALDGIEGRVEYSLPFGALE